MTNHHSNLLQPQAVQRHMRRGETVISCVFSRIAQKGQACFLRNPARYHTNLCVLFSALYRCLAAFDFSSCMFHWSDNKFLLSSDIASHLNTNCPLSSTSPSVHCLQILSSQSAIRSILNPLTFNIYTFCLTPSSWTLSPLSSWSAAQPEPPSSPSLPSKHSLSTSVSPHQYNVWALWLALDTGRVYVLKVQGNLRL